MSDVLRAFSRSLKNTGVCSRGLSQLSLKTFSCDALAIAGSEESALIISSANYESSTIGVMSPHVLMCALSN